MVSKRQLNNNGTLLECHQNVSEKLSNATEWQLADAYCIHIDGQIDEKMYMLQK